MAFDYGSYLKLSYWSEGEAICLLSSIDPDEYKNLLQTELENLSRDPWDGFVDMTFSRSTATNYQQGEILRNQQSDRLSAMQGIIDPTRTALERDMLAKIITPGAVKGGIDYFVPKKLITWAIFKGYQVPAELIGLAEQQTETAGSGVGRDAIKPRKRLKPLERETSEGLLLLYEIFNCYRVEYLDELPAHRAWGKVVSKEFCSDYICSITDTKKSIVLSCGERLDRIDFSDKYRRRFG